MNRKEMLSCITNNYHCADPEYFSLYSECQSLSQDIKFYMEQNQNIRIENQNMVKQQSKLKETFYSISSSIIKKVPMKLQNTQIKTRMRINQLRNKVKGNEHEIKKLWQQQKSFRMENVQDYCLQMMLNHIDLNSDILKYTLRLKTREHQNVDIPQRIHHDIDEFDEDDCRKIQQLKNSKRENLNRLKGELDEIENSIQKQIKVQHKLKQNKQKNMQTHKYYNKLIQNCAKQKKKDNNLSNEIDEIYSQIGRVKGQLQTYNIINQQLKQKLASKKDQELKQNKNLRQQIEKYTEQCKQIRNKYHKMLDIKKSKQHLQ